MDPKKNFEGERKDKSRAKFNIEEGSGYSAFTFVSTNSSDSRRNSGSDQDKPSCDLIEQHDNPLDDSIRW